MTGMRGLRDRKYRREPGSSARVLTLGATKEVVELFVKLWGSFVQVMELSKETGRDHGMASSYENSQRFTD